MGGDEGGGDVGGGGGGCGDGGGCLALRSEVGNLHRCLETQKSKH